MEAKAEAVADRTVNPAFGFRPAEESKQSGDRGLLLQAFETFNQASSSLELAFARLQERVQRLTEELEVKNSELEKSLREREEAQRYLKNILERLPCGVLVLDEGGGLTLCNPMASEVLVQTRLDRPGENGRSSVSRKILNCLSASASDGAGNTEVEIPVIHGDQTRILATSGTPLTDGSGASLGTLHIIRDITEVKALQEKNKRIERLSAMGEMAVELAHEIRNPLGSIELFSSLLVNELSGDTARWADNIRIGIRSLNTIVSNMLHFANPISPDFSAVNVHEIILEILRFSEPLMFQRSVHVETALRSANPVIQADPELLKQMILNLIFNAMKAMPSNGFLRIRTRTVALPDGDGSLSGLELQIEDTGIGIPPENLNRIFDPFFTTNRNGTGLGLSVVHQIVDKHNGLIRVESEVNRGTTFTVLFRNGSEKE